MWSGRLNTQYHVEPLLVLVKYGPPRKGKGKGKGGGRRGQKKNKSSGEIFYETKSLFENPFKTLGTSLDMRPLKCMRYNIFNI